MRKSLIAVLAMLASGAVLAQSSVTLYGVADVGVGKAKIDGADKVQMVSGSTMNNLTSRIGVTGQEDLGGGWHAGFTLESGLSMNNGAVGDDFWGREATLSLGGPYGTFTMGLNWTPADYAYGAWELTGLANYNIVENMFMDVGADFQDSSEFRYTSPEFAGLTAIVAYVTGADHRDLDGVYDNRHKWDLALLYEQGPIAASFDVNKLRGNKANFSLGGKYDFGSFAVAGSYTAARDMDLGGGFYGQRRGFTLGAGTTLGAVDLTLDVGRDTKKAFGIKKYTNAVVEAKYHLSKRTLAYAAFLRMDGTNNYGIGLQHSF